MIVYFFGLLKGKMSDEDREWLEDPKNMLLLELFLAEREARKGGKAKTQDCHNFEVNLMENLVRLRDALWDYSYCPSRGAVHMVKKPVKREIFAAPFVDRIIHHWIVMQISEWWEKRLNHNSCSCRLGKGTSYGIKLLDKRIRQVSKNFARDCYVVKLDITGYFMHIRRDILFKRVKWGLRQQFHGQHDDRRYKILLHAIWAVIFDNPVKGVIFQGNYEDWRDLPLNKSLFAAPPMCGLVIGNLTSQFFSNIYLDVLDRYITIDLGYKHYVRYVDDFCIVITPEQLGEMETVIRQIDVFLNGLGLYLNSKKTKRLADWQGVPFLGYVVKKGAVLPGKRIVKNFREAIVKVQMGLKDPDTITTYLGMMIHYNSNKVCAKIFDERGMEYEY